MARASGRGKKASGRGGKAKTGSKSTSRVIEEPYYAEDKEADRRATRREANRDRLFDTAAETADRDTELALLYVFKYDGLYEQLADELLDKTRRRRRWHWRHWLCRTLNDCAGGCQTGTYVDLAKKDAAQALHSQLRVPRVVAAVLTEGLAFGAKAALSPTILGPANLPGACRAAIVLVCPNLDRCPTQTDVWKAFLGPDIARALRAAVEGPVA